MVNKDEVEGDQVHQGQVWFDKYFLWFGLSIVITAVMYTVWGMVEILSLQPAP